MLNFKNSTNGKKVIISLAIVVAVILVAFVAMLFTVEQRVVGTWQRELWYHTGYSCNTYLIFEFEADGDATEYITNANTGAILETKVGYWNVSGFEVSYRERGVNGVTVLAFNPITGTMENNDMVYVKISK